MGRTVLIVEDTQLLRGMYCDRLTMDGYQCLLAGDGIEALTTLRTTIPDLILLDLVMPKMGGIEVLRALKHDPRLSGIPVVILSNLGQETDIAQCMEMGASDYLVKNDARPTDISTKIRSVLGASPATAPSPQRSYRLTVRDHAGDADSFVTDARLTRRLWCPPCEVELSLELVSRPSDAGWYDAHLICPSCGRHY